MKDADYVFEVSYEICNKVGGIYAVLKSKAARMIEQYGENYYTVGIYDPVKARIEFDEQHVPTEMRDAVKNLEDAGVKIHYGRWLIPGRPKTILVDASGSNDDKNRIKAKLWNDYRVDSLHSDDTFNDPVVWSTGVGLLLEELAETKPFSESKCVAHFHEWLAGAGMLHLVRNRINVATVFTTHATMLGRTIAGSGGSLHEMIDEGLGRRETVNPDLAKRYGVNDKHTMEVACALNTDVFTTVSEITGKEAQYILGRAPDVILLNGLDTEKFPDIDEVSVLRRRYRNHMRNFLNAYFLRYYYVDFYNIRSIFISGRYEFHNKGLDLFIDALGKLNNKLKANNVEKNVVVFILIPSGTRGENIEVLKNISLYEEMHEHVDEMLPEMKEKIITFLSRGIIPEKTADICPEESLQTCKKLIAHFTEKKGKLPPLCAFELSYPEQSDLIIQALEKNGLLNREEDKVKVIYYPAYLSSADRLIALDYDQATLTCDLGVFPSYYEPWGYTPLETAAQCSLSITTDLSGFGKFIEGKGPGIYVLKRDGGHSWEDVVEDLAAKMYEIVTLPRKELVQRRINAKELSRLADWKILVENYVQAHDQALKNVGRRMKAK